MRKPLVMLCAFDDWLANQLRTVVGDHDWLLSECRQLGAISFEDLSLRSAVLVIQVDLNSDPHAAATKVRQVRSVCPDCTVVIVSDSKVSEDDKAGWTAAWHQIGVSFILFPPLTRPVIEDLVCGLMDATIARRISSGIE